jgi:hypothetical protein
MKKLIRETAEEILQEYTNCYNEADEDCLVKMLEKLASNMAREIFEEIEKRLRQLADESKILRDKEINLGEKTQLNGEWIGVRLALRDIAELKKKCESEGADGE